MSRILSGIQTSGIMTLGNYLGAINNWMKIQDEHECYFFLADLHSLTVDQDPKTIRRNIKHIAATYLACGLEKSVIFQQSRIAEHSELAWLFSCITPIGWLNRMTQFKDKAGKNKEQASLGLYSYPVLMAADILLYKPDLVPVGDDQTQHIELTRDIAGAFNRKYETDYFKLPKAIYQKEAVRIMSLKDGLKKMSKSDPSDYSRINLIDDADEIASKIKKAKTDADLINFESLDNRPEAKNLLTILACLQSKEVKDIIHIYEGKGFKELKEDLTEILIEKITPIGQKIKNYEQDEQLLNKILDNGAEKAKKIANNTLEEIKNIVGIA